MVKLNRRVQIRAKFKRRSRSSFGRGRGPSPFFLEPLQYVTVFPNFQEWGCILNALLAVVQNGKLPFESDFLFVLACSTRQRSVGGELRGVPLSASPNVTHSQLLVLAS